MPHTFAPLPAGESPYSIMSEDLFDITDTAGNEAVINNDPATDYAATGGPAAGNYDENAIQTLSWNEHIRRRPGMYIGKLGDGSYSDDGIYVLVKEVVDNSIDEFRMGAGDRIDISISEEGEVAVRDYGRGVPLGKVKEVASDLRTGGKFDSKNFQKSVGLNGVGLKAVNALSTRFTISSVRDGQKVTVRFEKGDLVEQRGPEPVSEPNGTSVTFIPDNALFENFRFRPETVEMMVNNYTYLNTGLHILLNGRKYHSRNGLLDLVKDAMAREKKPAPLYPIIHLKGDDIEIVITHTDQNGEEYFSFVNGQHTTQGGTHLSAFREHVCRTIKEFSGKGYEFADIRNGMIAAVAVSVQEPVFESQTKTKLGSKTVAPDSQLTVNKFIGDFIKKELDDYLHRNTDTAEAMLHRIIISEKERKAMAGISKIAREKAKKVSLHNRKLRDCRIHLNDNLRPNAKEDRRPESAIFITEGDSASGTITKVRNAETQAVFSLRGKPKNSFGMTRELVYKNDEFNLLQAALNIEEGIEGLRYNKVIIATDADVDGMHIRLLMITFFLEFFPDLVKEGHVYILQTPLFRVRDKNAVRRNNKGKRRKTAAKENPDERDTYYCYSDEERENAISRIGKDVEITRFKGLGEINDSEFAEFIGPDMRLAPVTLNWEDSTGELLEFYMGKNTPERQNFIINNLVIEDDSEI